MTAITLRVSSNKEKKENGVAWIKPSTYHHHARLPLVVALPDPRGHLTFLAAAMCASMKVLDILHSGCG